MKKKSIFALSFLLVILVSGVIFAASDTTLIDLRDWVKVQIVSPLEANGGIPVNLQDQTSSPILIYANQVEGNATITENLSIGDYNITLDDIGTAVVGDYVGVFDLDDVRFYAGNILEINGNVVTMDTPSDFNFSVGAIFQHGIKNMNVDGSVTPQIFSLRGDPELNATVDVTRIIVHITDNTAMDDEKFGGLPALTRGVLLRRVDGLYQNIFNIKTNGEMGELAYDKTYDDKAPAGFFGFTSRLTFSGQSKIGVAIRLAPDEDLQVIIQDDLTGLENFKIMIEGHIVVD